MTYQLPQSVIDKIKHDLPKKPVSKEFFYLKNASTLIFIVLLFAFSFAFIQWIIQQARIFYVFWPFITNSWSGWIWVLIPEFAIFSLLSLIAIFTFYKSTDWVGVKYADMIVATSLVISLLINIPINTYAVDNISFIKQIHSNLLTSQYRIRLRDMHITDLEDKKEFYGFISSIEDGELSIDHGGVILNFNYNGEIEASAGQRIWVKFNTLQDTKEIVEYILFE